MGGSHKRLRQVSKRPNAVLTSGHARAEPVQGHAPKALSQSEERVSRKSKRGTQETSNTEFAKLAADAALASAEKRQRLQPQSVLFTTGESVPLEQEAVIGIPTSRRFFASRT